MRREQRDAWQAWRALPEGERARMQAARDAYRALPIARQQELRAQFDALDAGIRRGWLLGPTLGADWPRLHALFTQLYGERADGSDQYGLGRRAWRRCATSEQTTYMSRTSYLRYGESRDHSFVSPKQQCEVRGRTNPATRRVASCLSSRWRSNAPPSQCTACRASAQDQSH